MPGKKPSRNGGTEPDRSWELKEIQQLIDLLIEREVAEFEMEQDGMRIRILRQGAGGVVPVYQAAGSAGGDVTVQPTTPAPGVSPDAAAPAQSSEASSDENLHVMKSPIIGTFFTAPAPDAPPFVNLGDRVSVGQVLCIVEAMKLMNEIESEFAGEIVRIHPENGQPVEYGQPLFTIKPS